MTIRGHTPALAAVLAALVTAVVAPATALAGNPLVSPGLALPEPAGAVAMQDTVLPLPASRLARSKEPRQQLAQDSARVVELREQVLADPHEPSGYVELARVYASLGRRDLAEATLRQGLGVVSDEGPVRGELVRELAGQQRWADALEALGPLADRPAGRSVAARLRVNAGVAAFQAGDSATARTDWERALRDEPGLDPAASNLATLLMAVGEPDSAWSVARAALGRGADRKMIEPLRAEAAFRTVDLRLAHDDSTGARAALARWVDEASDADVLVRAASEADGVHDASLGDRAYRRALELHPEDASLVELAGVRAEGEADSARALGLYRRAARMNGGGAIALMGVARLGAPSPDSAQRLAHRAARIGLREMEGLEQGLVAEAKADGPPRSPTRTVAAGARRTALLAALRQALDRVVLRADDGHAELARLRRAYPESTLLDRYAARRAALDGRLADAADRYDELVHDAPTDTMMQRERADVLVRLGRRTDAIAAYERVLDMRPEDPNAFHALLHLRSADGSLERLLAQVRRLRVRLPDSAVLVDHEIELLHRLGRTEEAAQLARAKERKR